MINFISEFMTANFTLIWSVTWVLLAFGVGYMCGEQNKRDVRNKD